MNIKKRRLCSMFVALLLLLLLGGCSSASRTSGTVSIISPDFFGVGEELAQQLIRHRKRSFGIGEKLIFTSIVNLDQLHAVSRFGRVLSESLATRLFQHGYGVVEIRKTSGVLIKDNAGEIILTRDAARLASQHEADVIVAGTYSMTPETIIINVKFLDAISQEVLSVAGMELQRSHTINSLLSDSSAVVDARLSAYEL